MASVIRLRRWDAERAKVEHVCSQARGHGLSNREVRTIRRTAHRLARTHTFYDAGSHAEVILRAMLDSRPRQP